MSRLIGRSWMSALKHSIRLVLEEHDLSLVYIQPCVNLSTTGVAVQETQI